MQRVNKYSKEAWEHRMMKWCDYQERCVFEVAQKLKTQGCPNSWVDEIIAQLLEHKYIDETRFAAAYVSGKFRLKRWGRIKIRAGLRAKHIEASIIEKALEGIDETAYNETIEALIEKKQQSMQHARKLADQQKVTAYVVSKGYELSNVIAIMQDLQRRSQ